MARTKLNFGPLAKQKIVKGLQVPFEKINIFFNQIIGPKLHQDSTIAFKHEGQRNTNPRWPEFAPSTIKTPAGTWNIRYGTNGTPTPLSTEALKELRSKWIKRRGWGATGYMRNGVRRHDGRNLLVASGNFRDSFTILSSNKKQMRYGTRYNLAQAIMSNPTRNVLFITETDEKSYIDLFHRWYYKSLQF